MPLTPAEKSRRWRAKNRDKANEYNRKWREKNSVWRAAYFVERRESMTDQQRAEYNARQRAIRKAKQEASRPMPDVCDICGQPETNKSKRLAFDHCHQRGHFRGWLCARCNWILGRANDDPKLLRLMADYLERTASVDTAPAHSCNASSCAEFSSERL